MGAVKSAGVLLYREGVQGLEFFLLRPGGPFYKNDVDGIWTIPKGLIEPNESDEQAARREFKEETGFDCLVDLSYLTELKLRSGKSLVVFAGSSSEDYSPISSATFEMEYPKGSGQKRQFSEMVEGAWWPKAMAQVKIHKKQAVLLDMIEDRD